MLAFVCHAYPWPSFKACGHLDELAISVSPVCGGCAMLCRGHGASRRADAGQQAVGEHAVKLAVEVLRGLREALPLLLRERHNAYAVLGAPRFHLVHVLDGLAALTARGVERSILHQALQLVVQSGPEILRDDDGREEEAVLGVVDDAAALVLLEAVETRVSRLPALDAAVRHGLVDLLELDENGLRADGQEGLLGNGALVHAQGHAAEVLKPLDRDVRRDHAVTTAVGEGKAVHAGLLAQVAHEPLADIALKHALRMLVVTEQEGHVQGPHVAVVLPPKR
mmetsp:Transcript_23749/g.74768  ORF Transcript_23749/g.74768 Transcript_23749/m.74768 type:complete len:281 (-) Transcript_23749:328-1170(-)